jgi:hypothetical protein
MQKYVPMIFRVHSFSMAAIIDVPYSLAKSGFLGNRDTKTLDLSRESLKSHFLSETHPISDIKAGDLRDYSSSHRNQLS